MSEGTKLLAKEPKARASRRAPTRHKNRSPPSTGNQNGQIPSATSVQAAREEKEQYSRILWFFSELERTVREEGHSVTLMEVCIDFEMAAACEIGKHADGIETRVQNLATASRAAATINKKSLWPGSYCRSSATVPLGESLTKGICRRPILLW